MKPSFALFLLIALLGLSCSEALKEPSSRSETLRLVNETMRKTVDLRLNEAIWTDEQRGRNNEKWVNLLKELADSRKGLDIQNVPAVETHISVLKSLSMEVDEKLQVENSFDRIDHYLQSTRGNSSNKEMIQAEVSHVELTLIEQISRQLGIIDCCFPSPIKVQTNGDAAVGKPYEMAIFPGGERALWDQTSYAYENVYITKSGNKIPVEIETKRIGHVLTVQFVLADPGTYDVHFSITESGDYLAEPWQQDLDWSVEVR